MKANKGDISIKEAYNMELVFEAYKKQVNEDICLIGGNALDIPFKNCSFDWVVIKNDKGFFDRCCPQRCWIFLG